MLSFSSRETESPTILHSILHCTLYLSITPQNNSTCDMESYRNDRSVRHHPTSSAVDEMQPPTERVSKQRKQRKRPSAPEQPASREGLEKKERRRRQLLLAQRACRARKGAHIQALEKRVARLESALEQTGQAIISFTDTLVEPQALASHQKIAYHLRDTVKTCLDMANDCLEDVNDSNLLETSLIGHTSIVPQACARNEQEEWPLSEGHAGLSLLSRNLLPPSALNGAKVIEAPVFVDNLRIACLYQGFLLLNNSSVPLEALRRPFRLLLSLVTRETIASYFHTCLYARLNNKQPDHSSCIPSFRLGGAGTHYPEVVASNQVGSRSEQHDTSMIHDTLSAFSPEAQKELDGQWFDLFDLMGFLRAQGTTLSMVPPVNDTTHRTVNAVNFISALIGKGICLGDTPGFKRSDVEIAVDSSLWK